MRMKNNLKNELTIFELLAIASPKECKKVCKMAVKKYIKNPTWE